MKPQESKVQSLLPRTTVNIQANRPLNKHKSLLVNDDACRYPTCFLLRQYSKLKGLRSAGLEQCCCLRCWVWPVNKLCYRKWTESDLKKRTQKQIIFLTIWGHLLPLNNSPDDSIVIIKVMWGIIGGKTLFNKQSLFSNWLDKTIAKRPCKP